MNHPARDHTERAGSDSRAAQEAWVAGGNYPGVGLSAKMLSAADSGEGDPGSLPHDSSWRTHTVEQGEAPARGLLTGLRRLLRR